MANEYVRDPKGTKGFKHGPSEQDEEDCAQEKLIQGWLKQQGISEQFDFKHINSKGTARNTAVRAQVRLDQKIQDDSAGTFADLIVGSDGRDLYSGGQPSYLEIEPLEEIRWNLFFLGFNQGEIECLKKMLKLSTLENKSRLERLASDLEW